MLREAFDSIIDSWMSERIVFLWSPFLNKAMIFITSIASPLALSILSVAVLSVLIYKKRFHQSLLFLIGMIGGLMLGLLIKSIVHRARPQNTLVEAAGYSFPSGHASMALIFFSLVIYLFKNDIKSVIPKYSFIIGNITLFLLIGFSRVYLNVHWFSDVMAGFFLGLFWLTLSILIHSTMKY